MDEPHLKITDKAAPIVITYRRVFRRPTIEIERRFVGVYRFVKNAIAAISDLVEELAYEEKRNVTDPGESQAVHWALQVNEPFESEGTAEVIAIQTTGYRPPAGFHFEVITMPDPAAAVSSVSAKPPEGGAVHRRAQNSAYDRVRESLYGSQPPINGESPTKKSDEEGA